MNELPDVMDFVRRWPPFDRLDDAALELACRNIEVSYQPNDIELLAYGSDNNELHLVRKGAVGLFDQTGTLVDKRGEGECYGYPSLLTGKPASLAARTLEDTLVYHLPGATLHTLRARHPEFDRFFSARLIERVNRGVEARSGNSLAAAQVSRYMSTPGISVNLPASIGEAAREMAARKVSALPLLLDGQLRGIVTDRDLRNRVLAAGVSPEQAVDQIMTPDPATCSPDSSALQAQMTMLEMGVHHLPVVDKGELAGMLTLSDLLRAQNDDPVYFISRLKRSKDAAGVAGAAAKRFDLFASLVRSGVDATHVQRVMTAVTDAATRRLLTLAEDELGSPPMRYAWIGLGSQARREQTGRTDQDNGLILARQPTADEARWFERLAKRVCDGLNEAGFVYCPGDVMASNPKWRQSLDGWKSHFTKWITEPEPKALMFAAIFFDQRCIAGDAALVDELRQHVFGLARSNTIFLRHMAVNALEQQPPLSFFRNFILEDDGKHNEGLNLKHRGVVPIVSLARLKALELGIAEPDTRTRLELAAAHFSRTDMADLTDALELIGRIRHERQAEQIEHGKTPTNLVPPASLSPLTRRHLKAAFGVVRRAQRALTQLHGLE